jgi:3-oxoacyl-[acyl-carrier protein] reductase
MTAQRRILVTGSSRGLGQALARDLLDRGDQVIGCSRSCASIEHENYRHFIADVADDSSVREMFRGVSAAGGLHVLVNNAGVGQASLAVLTSAADAELLLRVNLLGAFLVSREAIKVMKRSRFGRIIHFSSVNARLGSIGSAIYNATKAAVENLALSLARECAADDITINALGLSLVEGTGMLEGLSSKAAAAKQQALAKPQPLTAAEILHAVDFLSAPQARNITGQTLYFGGPA